MTKTGSKNNLYTFHRTADGRAREITAGEQFEPQNLESFGPMTQEQYQLLPAMIHTHELYRKIKA
jgi:hypothetical protein